MKLETLGVKKGASTNKDARAAARELHEAIGGPDLRFVIFYASPDFDLPVLADELKRLFGSVPMIGCTTAGEITPIGYLHGSLTGVSVSAPDLHVAIARLDDLQSFEFAKGESVGPHLRSTLVDKGLAASGSNTFAFLLVDGLSMKEEPIVSGISRGLGDIQLFGGSAGDGVRFKATYIYHEGVFRQDCALLTLVHTEHPFVVFKTQHFVSSEDKMVVTKADPARRIVTEINGEPAGREYARLVGLDVDKLTPLIFSTYPVVVRLGGSYYVRSIQKVNDDESLTFFCAIDEGIVLTVARGVDLIENLSQTFDGLHQKVGSPELILGCDCILRDLEIGQRNIRDEVSELLVKNNVIGFSTYGEQFNAMHINQTFTGVAIGSRHV